MNLFKIAMIFSFALFVSSCSTKPDAINYGTDQCSYCKMNIVDSQHAAQFVTNKGKQFKFDAIECMIHDLADKKEADMAYILVTDYLRPNEMTDAAHATFLVSDAIKSPMGEFLSGFDLEQEAQKTQSTYQGQLYNWDQIKTHLNEN